MKKNKYLIKYITLLLILVMIISCGGYEAYKYVSTELPPYDVNSKQKDCNHQMQDIITLYNTDETISTCILCGYNEDGYKYYNNFTYLNSSTFLANQSKVIFKVDSSFNSYKLTLNKKINEVIFVGTEKTSLKNFQIKVLERTDPITIIFENITIYSENTIIFSEYNTKLINLVFQGNYNNLVTLKGRDGTDGKLEFLLEQYGGSYYANPGENGEDAANVIDIKGDLNIYAYSSVYISAGNGGNGGNGASHKNNSIFGAKNNGGNGGNGGRGGDAIKTDDLVSLKGNQSLITLLAGKGGNGGKCGSGESGLFGTDDGRDGSKGADGKIGIEYIN